jgi:hypothetical protein
MVFLGSLSQYSVHLSPSVLARRTYPLLKQVIYPVLSCAHQHGKLQYRGWALRRLTSIGGGKQRTTGSCAACLVVLCFASSKRPKLENRILTPRRDKEFPRRSIQKRISESPSFVRSSSKGSHHCRHGSRPHHCQRDHRKSALCLFSQ